MIILILEVDGSWNEVLCAMILWKISPRLQENTTPPILVK